MDVGKINQVWGVLDKISDAYYHLNEMSVDKDGEPIFDEDTELAIRQLGDSILNLSKHLKILENCI